MHAQPLVSVRDLAIHFAHPRPAVNSISLDIRPGEILALVGESGSGKSMTARAILGLLPPGSRATGSITFRGTELLGAPESDLNAYRGAEIALVFQEPHSALNPVRTVGWQLRQAIGAHQQVSRKDADARALELLRLVEIPEAEDRLRSFPHQLSGGQKQRVALALALANEPALLIADEPTTALDVTVQAEILALLGRLRDRIGTSILLITHNMGVVAELADRVIVLRQGDVVESATTGELFDSPTQPYTRQLLAAVPRLQTSPPSATAPAVQSTPPEWTVLAQDLTVVYPASRGRTPFRALHGVDLALARGEVLGLVGESGSGKSTLGRVVTGLIRPTGGSVSFDGPDLNEIGRHELRSLRRRMAFVHQDPASSLDPRFSVTEAVREPLDIHRIGTAAERHGRVAELLEAVRLPAELGSRRPHELSGGQRQRVALARALVLGPDLLVADEPTSALDVSVQAEVLELFAELQARMGFACLFISHDLAVIQRVADRTVVLKAGEVVESGPTDQIFSQPTQDYTRRLLAAVPEPSASLARRYGLTTI